MTSGIFHIRQKKLMERIAIQGISVCFHETATRTRNGDNYSIII